MQTQSASPVSPQPPAVSTAPVSGVSTIAPTPATTVFTIEQLRARGSELSRQLNSATSRRDGLSRDIRRASPDGRPGLQQQFDALSTRVVQLEQDISINGQLLVQARGLEGGDNATENGSGSSTGPQWPPQMSQIDGTAIGVCFTLFVLSPIAFAIARSIWKRGTRMSTAAPASRESDLRMERVEQAVDAIAVEVERISEGQRFVTQLMTQQSALGAGHAQPVRVPVAENAMAGYQQR